VRKCGRDRLGIVEESVELVALRTQIARSRSDINRIDAEFAFSEREE